MAYNETITLINYTKDLDFEYNIKLLLLGLLFVYSVAGMYISYKWKSDKYAVKIFKNLLMRLPSVVYLFFFPLFSIYLLRGVSWEVFYTLMIVFYTYSLVVTTISLKLGLIEYPADMLGIKPKIKEMRL